MRPDERRAVAWALAVIPLSLAMLAVSLVLFVVVTVEFAQAFRKPLVVTWPTWLVAWAGGLSGGARTLVEVVLVALLFGGSWLVGVITRNARNAAAAAGSTK